MLTRNFATASKEVLFRGSSSWILRNLEFATQPPSPGFLPISWDSVFQSSFAYPDDPQILDLSDQLLTLFRFLELACLTNSTGSNKARLQWAKMISPNTPLYLMFTSPYARDRRQSHPNTPSSLDQDEDREKIGYTQMSDQCRLWSLLILNLMLYIHQDSPLLPLSLRQLENKVRVNHPQFYNRFETLAAMLIGGDGEYELFDPKLIWYAGLLLSVTKLLSPYNWERVAQILMQSLVAFGSEEFKSTTTLQWEDHELRNDIVVSLCTPSTAAADDMPGT
jgi:hypothetical protein